jgi:hypothetical protein
LCHSHGMTSFLDKQGRFVLLLVAILGLCYVVAYAMTRKPDVVPEDIVKSYLNALQTGDFRTAYALLSEEDRNYFDIERFKDFLQRQPHLQLLYGGSEFSRGFAVREQMRYELVENKGESNTQQRVEVLMKVTLPDVAKILGPELLQFYLFGQENGTFSDKQSLEISKRLEARLRNLRTAPTLSSYQQFRLEHHKRGWQLSVPEWRVEAMVYEAKQKLIEQETKEAGLLLEQASNFVLKVDNVTRTTFVRQAIAGKHMLNYLPWVGIEKFQLGPQVGICRYPVALELNNHGNRSIRSADIVVQYLDDAANPQVVDDQVISLDQKSLAKQTGGFLPAEGKMTAKLCLTPPRDWSGRANTHIAWLTFLEEAN